MMMPTWRESAPPAPLPPLSTRSAYHFFMFVSCFGSATPYSPHTSFNITMYVVGMRQPVYDRAMSYVMMWWHLSVSVLLIYILPEST